MHEFITKLLSNNTILFRPHNNLFFIGLFSIWSCSIHAEQPTLLYAIDSIYVNGKSKNLQSNTLSLDAAKDTTVLFFTHPCTTQDLIAFAWEGVDNNPVLCQNGVLHYTHLKGGEYNFSIGRIVNGKFNKEYTFPIHVDYTLTEEPLFLPSVFFALLLLFVGIIYFWISYSFRQRMNVQNLRNQIASDLHDEVGSTLSSIAVLSKVLRRNLIDKMPELIPILDKILESSKDTIINLRDTVWTINPANDSVEQMMLKMRSFAYEMLIGEEIALHYYNEFDEKPKLYHHIQISMEQRRNTYLMFKECVHNIVKHAHATEAKISISRHDDGVFFHIQDNGKGFDAIPTSTNGNGLNNLRQRAKECFITFHIASVAQQGTSITMLVPEL